MAKDAREAKKAETHQAILESAADLIRKEGINAASVSKVMEGAGKTVGGFYAHFESKQHLFAEALQLAMAENATRLIAGLEDASVDETYTQVVKRYLSRQLRDMGEQGCPFPTILSEMDGADEIISRAFIEGFGGLVEMFTTLFEDKEDMTARQRALGTLATMIGALALAKATRGSEFSDEVLMAGRKLLFNIEGEKK